MVVLLVAHHVEVGVELVFAEAALGRAEVLRDIDGSTVRTEEELSVEAVGGKITPHRAVGIALENAHIEALLHQLLAEQVGLVLIKVRSKVMSRAL